MWLGATWMVCGCVWKYVFFIPKVLLISIRKVMRFWGIPPQTASKECLREVKWRWLRTGWLLDGHVISLLFAQAYILDILDKLIGCFQRHQIGGRRTENNTTLKCMPGSFSQHPLAYLCFSVISLEKASGAWRYWSSFAVALIVLEVSKLLDDGPPATGKDGDFSSQLPWILHFRGSLPSLHWI